MTVPCRDGEVAIDGEVVGAMTGGPWCSTYDPEQPGEWPRLDVRTLRLEFDACEYDVRDVEIRVDMGARHRVLGGARRKRARVRRVA